MSQNLDTSQLFDSYDDVEQARRLLDASRARDTGEPRLLHLPKLPYELPIVLSRTAIRGLLNAAERTPELGLDATNEKDAQILNFANRLRLEQQPTLDLIEKGVRLPQSVQKISHAIVAFALAH